MRLYDVIIVGGSYAGLSAGMALGRALKDVLIIDNGKACNRQTPYSHNFLTNDGKSPAEIASIANRQLSRYQTIHFINGSVISANRTETGFAIRADTGREFAGKKIVFATGIIDQLPVIAGLADCWGISALHCPFCHGYEVRNRKTAVLVNDSTGYDFVRLISNWTKDLTLLTNGIPPLTAGQVDNLKAHNICIIDKAIDVLENSHGYIQNIVFRDGTKFPATVIYAPSPFEQQSKVPEMLGCQLTEEGYIQVDPFQETTAKGIYACGDNSNRLRTIANAVATGTTAGMTISKRMILEEF